MEMDSKLESYDQIPGLVSCRGTEELKMKDSVPPDMRKLNEHIRTHTIGFSHPAREFPQSI